MSGRGFGTKPKKENNRRPKKQGSSNISQDSSQDAPQAPLSESTVPFTPRGPTLREEYERKGLIEPSLSPDAGTLPEIVANRMLRRILGFGGVPLSGLFLFFGTYFLLKYKYDITVLPVVVAYTTLGTIALATFGITYGIFSSSWDEDIEGSALGWEEATKNFIRAKDGLFGARQRELKEEELARIDELAEKDSQSEECRN